MPTLTIVANNLATEMTNYNVTEKDKCDELKFFKLDELPINVITYVRKGIENYLNDEPFSIYGW